MKNLSIDEIRLEEQLRENRKKNGQFLVEKLLIIKPNKLNIFCPK